MAKGPGRVLQLVSRALGKHEKNYGQTELEGLAVVWAVSLFRPYLIGRKFTIVTDCQALRGIFSTEVTPKSSGRMTRWAMRLQEYSYEVLHRPGKQCPHVDCLSRVPAGAAESGASLFSSPERDDEVSTKTAES